MSRPKRGGWHSRAAKLRQANPTGEALRILVNEASRIERNHFINAKAGSDFFGKPVDKV